jgi:predicted component of type VI protein secretion system
MTASRGRAVILYLAVAGLMILFSDCSSVPKNILEEIPGGSNAISIHIKAIPMLGRYCSELHTLVLCIYQLNDLKVFEDLGKTDEGISRLTSCDSFGDSVTASQRAIVNPGQDSTLVLDREKGTLFVGIVPGYYNPPKNGGVEIYKIPLTVYREGFAGWKNLYRWPEKLLINLNLDVGRNCR